MTKEQIIELLQITIESNSLTQALTMSKPSPKYMASAIYLVLELNDLLKDKDE